MHRIHLFILKLYKDIKTEYWSDPVWSKVISAGIIALIGLVLTGSFALMNEISFKQAFKQLLLFFQQRSAINNLALTVCIIIILFILTKFLLAFQRSEREKQKMRAQLKEKETVISDQSAELLELKHRIEFERDNFKLNLEDIPESVEIVLSSYLKKLSGVQFSSQPIPLLIPNYSLNLTELSKTTINSLRNLRIIDEKGLFTPPGIRLLRQIEKSK